MPPVVTKRPARLLSVDACRGLVMVVLAFDGFGVLETARQWPESPFWRQARWMFDHVPWRGGAPWDMIQPLFMFVVGVAMSLSLAGRIARGDSAGAIWRHVWWRAMCLVALGVGLTIYREQKWQPTFTNVLAQMGLGYPLLYWLSRRDVAMAWGAAALLLVGYWGWFAAATLPGPEFDRATVGVPQSWPHTLTGFEAHWNKNTNPAARVDGWLLNLLPRSERFVFNAGGYTTLNFVPSLVTMWCGAWAGTLLLSRAAPGRTAAWLVAVGLGAIGVGMTLDTVGVCPLVKRIWTPSWAIYSAGWCWLTLGLLHAALGGATRPGWSWPLVVAGSNSLLLYVLYLQRWWTQRGLETLGVGRWVERAGPYAPMVWATLIGLLYWLLVYGLYRRRWFLRL